MQQPLQRPLGLPFIVHEPDLPRLFTYTRDKTDLSRAQDMAGRFGFVPESITPEAAS